MIMDFDLIIIGGGMAYTFRKVMGREIGNSICEDDKLDIAKDLLKKATAAQPDIIMLNSLLNSDHKIIKDLKIQKGMENVMVFIYE